MTVAVLVVLIADTVALGVRRTSRLSLGPERQEFRRVVPLATAE